MFCDLVGSTPLSARVDPEDLRGIIGAYHRCVTQIVEGFGGFVARYMGDGVLIYFGYPQAHEDDAKRATRCGLALVDRVPQLGQGEELHARVGIATGLVVVGGEVVEHDVAGDTPNLAARLQALAEPDNVVIATSTHRLTGDLFEYRDLGDIELKGIGEPVPAWQVLRPSTIESRFEALRGSALSPLIGRDEEIDLLLRRWARAKMGDGQIVLVSGEPGIGKSRLAAALTEHPHSEPHTRLPYFCSPYHQDSALYPFIAQLERAAGFARDDTPEAKLDRLEALLAPTAPPDEDIALLADLLLLPASGRYQPLDLTPQRKKEKTFEAWLRQLGALAVQQPVLVIFEDLHWIDPTSRELLDLIIERIEHWSVLLVATYRPEFQPPWTGHPQVTVLSLNRLSQRHAAILVQFLAGDAAALPSDVADEIVARSDGVPLFLEEVTKAVLESATGPDQPRAMVSASPGAGLAVPATLQASLMARLDRLGPAAKEVAQIGAVIGREFSFDLLAAAARDEIELQSAITKLVEAGLVFQRGIPPQASFLFKHALVQDAAYGTLLRGPRQLLHARIADALLSTGGERPAAAPEIIAHHLQNAGRPVEAIVYWREAGERVVRRAADREAIEHFRRALSLLQAQPETAERWRAELAILSQLAPALTEGRHRRWAKWWSAPPRSGVSSRARPTSRRPLPIFGSSIKPGVGSIGRRRSRPICSGSGANSTTPRSCCRRITPRGRCAGCAGGWQRPASTSMPV
jgi:class 3 adenylate cyclase/tetratricopeptide (TPR) repeat protein